VKNNIMTVSGNNNMDESPHRVLVAGGRSGKFGPPLVVHRNGVVDCGVGQHSAQHRGRDGDEASTRSHGIASTSITRTSNTHSIPLLTTAHNTTHSLAIRYCRIQHLRRASLSSPAESRFLTFIRRYHATHRGGLGRPYSHIIL